MKQYLLPKNGKFYKANLHHHTVLSDGEMGVEETKKAYMEKGYSIVAFTDHEVIIPHNDLSDENFLAITSFEIQVNPKKPAINWSYTKACHMNFYAKDKNNLICPAFDPKYLNCNWLAHTKEYATEEMYKHTTDRDHTTECFNKMIKEANEAGFLVSYNHPVWNRHNYLDYSGLKGLWAVECYNSGCAWGNLEDSITPVDDINALGERVVPIATDDTHYRRDAFGGWTMIKADNLEYDTILKAMEKGDLYASTGPEINELYLEDGVLHVKCSPAKIISFSTERRYGRRWVAENEPLTQAELDINHYFDTSRGVVSDMGVPFFRITITDFEGKKAYSRAYYVDEILEVAKNK